ncbi:MAG: tRNA (adenosine(37)-N6)-dimethylallyltransferase MiaA, partial [Nitrososphaeraceae archaeon]|nr:tRNA (adenosine(37)-N6)-dimethylallyltransferase MiaA [Nitrososphaeraceae archaeon]
SGKTKIASIISQKFNCEVISADSRQVYKRMDIGTGKDLHEFNSRKINYHLIDIVEPNEEYNLFRFQQDFYEAYKKIKSVQKQPLLIGGSGLYLSSILEGYDLKPSQITENENSFLNNLTENQLRKMLFDLKPEQHNTTDLLDKKRTIRAIIVAKANKVKSKSAPILNSINIGITLKREELKKRITERLKQRLQAGMIDEVKSLIDDGITKSKLISFGLEYKYVCKYLNNELNHNDMFQKLNSAIHSFARRQMTWFRKMEKKGVNINWFDPGESVEIVKFIKLKTKDEKYIT